MIDDANTILYNYELPTELIAQRPVYPYDQARMLVVDRNSKSLIDSSFINLPDFLRPNDLLIFNNTAVIPARLTAQLDTGSSVEILLLEELSDDIWLVMGKPLKKIKNAGKLNFSEYLQAVLLESVDEKKIKIKFTLSDATTQNVRSHILALGSMPIPPYIRKGQADQQDVKDYQSIFANLAGSVAAPTASLHFTPELLAKLEQKGCCYTCLTLHVGTASFLPLFQAGSAAVRIPDSEYFTVPDQVIQSIELCKKANARVIAVGTTVVRALESWASNKVTKTDLFICPGYKYQVCDLVITNFHQPATTHLALVEAFLGYELLDQAYQHALKAKYRFLSYGDGMLFI